MPGPASLLSVLPLLPWRWLLVIVQPGVGVYPCFQRAIRAFVNLYYLLTVVTDHIDRTSISTPQIIDYLECLTVTNIPKIMEAIPSSIYGWKNIPNP